MSAPLGNQNAAKPEEARASSVLTFRVKRTEKASYVRAAAGRKLVDWVRDTLNAAVSANSVRQTPIPPKNGKLPH